jgi:hypothetical protein
MADTSCTAPKLRRHHVCVWFQLRDEQSIPQHRRLVLHVQPNAIPMHVYEVSEYQCVVKSMCINKASSGRSLNSLNVVSCLAVGDKLARLD